jgi:hypothetical protein
MTRAGELLAWQSAQALFCAGVADCAVVAPASRTARNNSAMMASGTRPTKIDGLKIVFIVSNRVADFMMVNGIDVAGPRVGDVVIKTVDSWKRNYEIINRPVEV